MEFPLHPFRFFSFNYLLFTLRQSFHSHYDNSEQYNDDDKKYLNKKTLLYYFLRCGRGSRQASGALYYLLLLLLLSSGYLHMLYAHTHSTYLLLYNKIKHSFTSSAYFSCV